MTASRGIVKRAMGKRTWTKKSTTVEARKTNNQLKDFGVRSVLDVADAVLRVINDLRLFCKKEQCLHIKNCINSETQIFMDDIKEIEQKVPLTENLTMMKFLHFIIEEELKSLSDLLTKVMTADLILPIVINFVLQ